MLLLGGFELWVIFFRFRVTFFEFLRLLFSSFVLFCFFLFLYFFLFLFFSLGLLFSSLRLQFLCFVLQFSSSGFTIKSHSNR